MSSVSAMQRQWVMKLASAMPGTYECPYKVRRDLRHAWAAGWGRGREQRQKTASGFGGCQAAIIHTRLKGDILPT
jgi:hypothetical protein